MNKHLKTLFDAFKRMDPDKRKSVLFAAAVAVALLLWLAPIPFRSHHQAVRAGSLKPSPYGAMPRPPAAQPIAPAPAAAVSGTGALMGIWQSSGPVQALGMCSVKLELRPAQEQSRFAGYSSFTCVPLTDAQRAGLNSGLPIEMRNNPAMAMMLGKMTPVSSILAGEEQDGAIAMRVTKTIGASSPCVMSSMTATPFGERKIAVEWKYNAPGCTAASFVMEKAGA